MNVLLPFSPDLALPHVQLRAEMRRVGEEIEIRFELEDPLGSLLDSLGPTQSWEGNEAKRTHELWKTTCFEAFWGLPGEAGYWELNLSSDGHYNIYRFENYRAPQPPMESHDYEIIEIKVTSGRALECRMKAKKAKAENMEVNICAVLRAPQGTSFYSLAHKGAKPDFHLRKSFCLMLGRA